MKIKKLKLKNFRNYEFLDLEFDDQTNIFYGNNAQGKTNILEAIFFMIIGKSFRTSKEKEVISLSKENAYIKGEFKKKYRDIEIEIYFNSSHKKSIKIDKLTVPIIDFPINFVPNLYKAIINNGIFKIILATPSGILKK